MAIIQLINHAQLIKSGVTDKDVLNIIDKLYTTQDLYLRIDLLIELDNICSSSNLDALNTLRTQTRDILEVMLDSNNLDQDIDLRKKHKFIDPFYLPNHPLSHLSSAHHFSSRTSFIKVRTAEHLRASSKRYLELTYTMKKMDERLKVKRLTSSESEGCRVLIGKGRMWKISEPDSCEQNLSITTFDTQDYIAHSKIKGRAIFVVNTRGELFASSSEIGKFHHSSILNGSPVLCAGMLEVADGKLTYINDQSGHYSPRIYQFFQVLKILKARNILNIETLIQTKNTWSGSLFMVEDQYLNTKAFLNPDSLSQPQPAPNNREALYIYDQLMDSLAFCQDESLIQKFAVVIFHYLKIEAQDNVFYIEILNELRTVIKTVEINFQDFERHANALKGYITMQGLGIGTDWLSEVIVKYQSQSTLFIAQLLGSKSEVELDQIITQILLYLSNENKNIDLLKQINSDFNTLCYALVQLVSDQLIEPQKTIIEMTQTGFMMWIISKIEQVTLNLSGNNLALLTKNQIHLILLICKVKKVTSLNLASCKMSEVSLEKFTNLVELFSRNIFTKVTLASNQLSTFSEDKIKELFKSFTSENSSIRELNLADNSLVTFPNTHYELLLVMLPKTNINTLSLALSSMHLLPLEQLTKLMDVIVNSNIVELRLTFTPLEKLKPAEWELFKTKLAESKIQKLIVSNKKPDPIQTKDLESILQNNLKRSFVASWGLGLKGLVSYQLSKMTELNTDNQENQNSVSHHGLTLI